MYWNIHVFKWAVFHFWISILFSHILLSHKERTFSISVPVFLSTNMRHNRKSWCYYGSARFFTNRFPRTNLPKIRFHPWWYIFWFIWIEVSVDKLGYPCLALQVENCWCICWPDFKSNGYTLSVTNENEAVLNQGSKWSLRIWFRGDGVVLW